MQTTAAIPKVGISAATIKTLLQFKASASIVARIIEYGISFDGNAAAVPGQVELIETDVAATVTAFVAADITKYDSDALMGGDPTTNLIQIGTTASGYTASGEGSITAVRNLDGPQLIMGTNQYIKQFPLGREPIVQVGKFARIRCTFPAAVNGANCYMIISI